MSQPERLDTIVRRLQLAPPVLTPEEQAKREQEAREWAAMGERLARQARHAWKTEAGVPKRYLAATLTSGKPTAAVAAVRQYLESGDYAAGRALILLGPTGVGKTWAVCAAFDALAAEPPRAAYFHFAALVGELLDVQRRRGALDRAKGSRFVALDDLGAAYSPAGGMAEALIEEILVEREAEELATILTSNWTVDTFRQRLSDRIVDRLHTWGRVVAVAGPSLRRGER